MELITMLMFVGSGLMMAALAIPLILHKIAPNLYYGFRVAKTMNNPDVWYPANEYCGRLLFGYGIITILVSLGLYFLLPQSSNDLSTAICCTLLIVGAVIVTLLSFFYLNKLDG